MTRDREIEVLKALDLACSRRRNRALLAHVEWLGAEPLNVNVGDELLALEARRAALEALAESDREQSEIDLARVHLAVFHAFSVGADRARRLGVSARRERA